MKKERLDEAMGLLSDELIEETNAVRERKRRPHRTWWKYAGAAACLAVAAAVGVMLYALRAAPQLPMLTLTDGGVGGMGYEGYMAYDISELVSANPWNEAMRLKTLPVYANPITYNEYQIASGADFEKMRALLLDVAGRLGLDTSSLVITDDAPDEETQKAITEKFASVGETVPEGYFNPGALTAEADGVTIEVDCSLTARIDFDPAAALPEEYNFTYRDSSYDDMAAAAAYLKERYKALLGMKDPQINITGGDRTNDGEQGYGIAFFEGSGSDRDRVIQYNFNRAVFACNDEGKLWIVRLFAPDLSHKLGDYPIISAGDAQKLLANGNYITSVPHEMPGMGYVRKVELIYRTSSRESIWMPYYRFYVELPEEQREGGLIDYGAYYVPAVEGQYLTEMPVWDGSFN